MVGGQAAFGTDTFKVIDGTIAIHSFAIPAARSVFAILSLPVRTKFVGTKQ